MSVLQNPEDNYVIPYTPPTYEEIAPFFFDALNVQIANAVSMDQTNISRELNNNELRLVKPLRAELKLKGYTSRVKNTIIFVSWSTS